MIDSFYKYLIETYINENINLNNIDKYFTFHKIVDSGYNAKGYINNEAPSSSFNVVYSDELVKRFILYPSNDKIIFCLNDIKEYLKTEYKVFNNFREMTTEFEFTIRQNKDISFISYKDIRLKDGVLILYENGIIEEKDIFCDKLDLRIKLP